MSVSNKTLLIFGLFNFFVACLVLFGVIAMPGNISAFLNAVAFLYAIGDFVNGGLSILWLLLRQRIFDGNFRLIHSIHKQNASEAIKCTSTEYLLHESTKRSKRLRRCFLNGLLSISIHVYRLLASNLQKALVKEKTMKPLTLYFVLVTIPFLVLIMLDSNLMSGLENIGSSASIFPISLLMINCCISGEKARWNRVVKEKLEMSINESKNTQKVIDVSIKKIQESRNRRS